MLHADLLRATDPAHRVPDWPARLQSLAASARDARLRAFYAAGTVPGETPLAATPLVALDVETTGLDPVHDGIVSIGVVPFGLERIRTSQARHWIVKPRVPLGEVSVTLHGITDSQIRQAPDLDAVLGEVLAMLAGQVVVVHCREIERRFLNGALRSRIGEDIEFPVIDTMALEAQRHRGPARPWLQRWLRGPAPPVSIRLTASRERYGLPRYALHHALTDALATAELLLAQVADRYTPHTPVRALWC
jgi:DNA polymerase III subunit epsilon